MCSPAEQRWTAAVEKNAIRGLEMTTDVSAKRSETRTNPLVTRVNRMAPWGARLRDAEWRRYGYVLLAGKLAGATILFGAFLLAHNGVVGSAIAEDAAPLTGTDIVSPINTLLRPTRNTPYTLGQLRMAALPL